VFTLKEYLSESTLLVEKKVSLSHAEDLILTGGYEGARSALEYLEGVVGMLAGDTNARVNVTTKWDGAPAIFAGKNPENGKFFVGTKGIFTKSNPKILYTNEDIEHHYGDKPDLVSKLKAALKYLPKLGIKNIIQGDIMFSEGDVKRQTIHGEDYVTFHPNTILYAVPANSKLAKQIEHAKLGVIFHTAYTGDSIHSLTSSYKVDVASLRKNPDVWFDDATYRDASGSVTLTAEETANVNTLLSVARTALAQITKQDLELLFSNKTFVGLIQQFINHRIRGGVQLSNMDKIADEMLQFLEMKVNKEKTQPATKEKKIQRLHAHAQEIKEALMKVFAFQKQIVDIKNILIGKLEAAKSIGTFHVTERGIEVAPQEGFVAVDHLGNNAIKLVDRLSFSRANFARHAKPEEEEVTAVVGGPSIMTKGSYLGGPTGSFSDSTGTL